MELDWKIAAAGWLFPLAAQADAVGLANGARLLVKRADLGQSLKDYLYPSRTGFRVPMGNGLSLGSQLNLDCDAVPAMGKDSIDAMLIFKLGYTI